MSANAFVLVRAYNRMKAAGYLLTLNNGKLLVQSDSELSDKQAAFIGGNKAALVQLLTDAENLAALLEQAGSAGLGWKEATPPEWSDDYLLALGEVLYGTGRMVNRLGRRYATAVAPPLPNYGKALNVSEIAPQAETKALSEASA